MPCGQARAQNRAARPRRQPGFRRPLPAGRGCGRRRTQTRPRWRPRGPLRVCRPPGRSLQRIRVRRAGRPESRLSGYATGGLPPHRSAHLCPGDGSAHGIPAGRLSGYATSGPMPPLLDAGHRRGRKNAAGARGRNVWHSSLRPDHPCVTGVTTFFIPLYCPGRSMDGGVDGAHNTWQQAGCGQKTGNIGNAPRTRTVRS